MSDFIYREPALIVCDILQSELGLTGDQVMMSNQKFEIPLDGLFISVSYVGPSKILASNDAWEDAGAAGLNEIQSLTMTHMIQIDIMSFDNSARMRKEEIQMALHSLFSESLQEQYQMHIAKNIGPIMD